MPQWGITLVRGPDPHSHELISTPKRLRAQATADNLTRATNLVVKLTKDYNTLCRDAAKKEAQLETLQSMLRELQELVRPKRSAFKV